MMHDACFCGWSGEIADREPVFIGNSIRGLACPACGHLDNLEWLPKREAHILLEEATRRQYERGEVLSFVDTNVAHQPIYQEETV